jgi:hypothetical protein
VLGAGVLYAFLLLPRWSPIGTAVVGAAYVGATVWAFADVDGFGRAMPHDLIGIRGSFTFPAVPFTAVLGIPLLATALMGGRWRRADRRAATYPPPTFPPPPPPGSPVGQPEAPAPFASGSPIGAPYGGPSSYSAEPSAPPPYPDPASPPPYGAAPPPYPPPPGPSESPFSPDVTRRI